MEDFISIKDFRIRKASIQAYGIIENEAFYSILVETCNNIFDIPCDSKDEAYLLLMKFDNSILKISSSVQEGFRKRCKDVLENKRK